jgi:hypothetical protein
MMRAVCSGSYMQNLSLCVVVVQEGEVYISQFNQGVRICAMCLSTILTEYLNANAVFVQYGLKRCVGF